MNSKQNVISEKFIQFIWKQRLFQNQIYFTRWNDKIEIVSTGILNADAGPDFFNAKVKINETLWVGNIEIHTNTSDWKKHNHHQNKVYDNVILQVVINNDCDVERSTGEIVPTIEIKFDENIWNNYDKLLQSQSWIACEKDITNVDSFFIESWLQTLLVERLEQKSQKILDLLESAGNSWEESFYWQLSHTLGFKVNAEPFERLAKSLPLSYLGKHKNNLHQIEAMLFGQAGFLEADDIEDEYYKTLRNEYLFFRHKFGLQPIEKHLWKFMRLRPFNFPTLRIAQLAKLIHSSTALFSKVIETKDIQQLMLYFDIAASEYWDTHYTFGNTSHKQIKTLGKNAVNTIIINVVTPFLFVYGLKNANDDLKDSALNLLENIPAENNSIIEHWTKIGVKPESAFHTQALLQLKNHYCDQKKCLECNIGGKIVKTN